MDRDSCENHKEGSRRLEVDLKPRAELDYIMVDQKWLDSLLRSIACCQSRSQERSSTKLPLAQKEGKVFSDIGGPSQGSSGFGWLPAMAPHLTPSELDLLQQQAALGTDPQKVHRLLKAQRKRRKIPAPRLTRARKALKGLSYRRGVKETRGRKPVYTPKNVQNMEATRKKLIQQANGDREVRWKDIQKASRVPKAHRTTAARAFAREGLDVQARRPREKPDRTLEAEKARVAWCKKNKHLRGSYFADQVDMIIDNKKFEIPTSERSRRYLNKQRVRFHLRKKSEGLRPEMTKPNRKKNRLNTGGWVNVCAGISGCRVVMWEYLGRRWSGSAAAELYSGPIAKSLKKKRGEKRKYRILEDNDRSGYKSKAAMVAKAAVHIEAIDFPKYSPDLNPLDFAIWSAIEKRMGENAPSGQETTEEYKKRLRATALRLPESLIRKSILSIPSRMKAIASAKGRNIARD